MAVAKGTDIMYNMYSHQRDAVVFGSDAEVFHPKRWAENSMRPGWNFVPFGGGPRVCLGQQYALTEIEYVTVRLMQKFGHIEDRDGGVWEEKLTAVCASLHGCNVALRE
jgi:cytochrome P450